MIIELKSESKRRLKPDRTGSGVGIPVQRRLDLEARSGVPLNDVRIHYNSERPAQLDALAYTQGNQVYLGPGQERHLGHELGHAIQQKQGRVPVTGHVAGLPLNDDPALEREADTVQIPWGKTGSESAQPVQRIILVTTTDDSAQNTKPVAITCMQDLGSQKFNAINADGDEEIFSLQDFYNESISYLRSAAELPPTINNAIIVEIIVKAMNQVISSGKETIDIYQLQERLQTKFCQCQGIIFRDLGTIKKVFEAYGGVPPTTPFNAIPLLDSKKGTSNSHSYPNTGLIYREYQKLIDLNLIPKPATMPKTLLLFHQGGHDKKIFAYVLPDTAGSGYQMYHFATGKHYKGENRSDLYTITGCGAFPQLGDCIRLANARMYLGQHKYLTGGEKEISKNAASGIITEL